MWIFPFFHGHPQFIKNDQYNRPHLDIHYYGVIILFIKGYNPHIQMLGSAFMVKYEIELSDELSVIYEDIAKMNEKSIEESLSIILER